MGAVADPDEPLHFTAQFRDGGPPLVLVLAGELDIAAASPMQDVAAPLGSTTGAVHVDLSGVTFVDVGGLRLLHRLQDAAEAAGASTTLVGVPPGAQRLMELAGFPTWRSSPAAPAARRGAEA